MSKLPRLGVLCSLGAVADSDCRTCALNPLHPCALTPDALTVVRDEKGEPGADAFTPSRLLDCFRKPVLMEQYDYYQSIDYAYPFVRGTVIHGGFEQLDYPGAEIRREERLSVVMEVRGGAVTFTGKPDAVVLYPDGRTVVVDYKTRTIDHQLISADRNHQMQVNMYAWLVQHAYGVKVTELEIVYIGINGMRRFTSAGELSARGKKVYKTQPAEYETLTLAAITLLPMERVEKFIRARIEAKIEAREKLPPILEGDAAKWCYRCPVYKQCMERGNE